MRLALALQDFPELAQQVLRHCIITVPLEHELQAGMAYAVLLLGMVQELAQLEF